MQPAPTSADLLAAVAQWLDTEAVPGLPGGVGFTARVASGVVRQIERELRLGPDHHTDDRTALAALLHEVIPPGAEQDRELLTKTARALRSRELDAATALPVLRALAHRKLLVSNPSYLPKT